MFIGFASFEDYAKPLVIELVLLGTTVLLLLRCRSRIRTLLWVVVLLCSVDAVSRLLIALAIE